MNTESMNALKRVRELLNQVQIEFHDVQNSDLERDLLGEALLVLNRIEDVIINSMLQDMADKINLSNDKLKQLISQMEAESDRIAEFSKKIKKISDVVGVLAEITSKAVSAGLLS